MGHVLVVRGPRVHRRVVRLAGSCRRCTWIGCCAPAARAWRGACAGAPPPWTWPARACAATAPHHAVVNGELPRARRALIIWVWLCVDPAMAVVGQQVRHVDCRVQSDTVVRGPRRALTILEKTQRRGPAKRPGPPRGRASRTQPWASSFCARRERDRGHTVALDRAGAEPVEAKEGRDCARDGQDASHCPWCLLQARPPWPLCTIAASPPLPRLARLTVC